MAVILGIIVGILCGYLFIEGYYLWAILILVIDIAIVVWANVIESLKDWFND